MFKLFKRRTDKPSVMYGVFQKVGNAVDHRQRQCADFLNKRTQHITGKRLLLALVFFCLCFGSGAYYVLWQALNTPYKTVAVTEIKVPRHALPAPTNEKESALLADHEIRHIQSFLHYLDSLQQTPAGQKKYDSIKLHRPGLLDSLALIQQLYSEQLKTK